MSGEEGYVPELFLTIARADDPALSGKLAQFAVDMKIRDCTCSILPLALRVLRSL